MNRAPDLGLIYSSFMAADSFFRFFIWTAALVNGNDTLSVKAAYVLNKPAWRSIASPQEGLVQIFLFNLV